MFKDILSRKFKDIEPALNGSKLMKLDVENVRFADSLLFFQQQLAALPKCFGIPNTAKGYFPYLLNIPENKQLICPLNEIPVELFGLNTMKLDARKKFLEWYEDMLSNNYVFDMQKEIDFYCFNDVKILIKSIMSFRELFIKYTELDPLSRNFTLASVGLEYFRSNILEENSIGVTPIDYYGKIKNNSAVASAWLDWQQKLYNKQIIREYRIGPYWRME